MPSASPLYTFSSVFNEPETPHVVTHSTNSGEATATSITNSGSSSSNSISSSSCSVDSSSLENATSNDTCGSNILSMTAKSDGLSNKNANLNSSTASSRYTYDPFKCLSAMAEQSLTGNFTHASSSTSAGIDNSLSNNRGTIDATSNDASHNNITSNTFLNLEHSTQFPQCEDVYLSTSTASLSSTSPRTSPSSTHYTFMPTSSLDHSTDFLHTDRSDYHKAAQFVNGSQSHDVNRSGQLGSSPSRGQHSTAGVVVGCEKTVHKKSYPSCSSEHSLDEDDKLLSWTLQHPEGWTNSQVLDWVFFVAQERGLNMQEFRGENFQAYTGAQLCQMSLEDFIKLEPKYGKTMYGMFRKLLCGVVFRKPMDPDHLNSAFVPLSSFSSAPSPKMTLDTQRYTPSPFQIAGIEGHECSTMTQNTFFKQERCSDMENDGIDITSYDFDLDDTPCFTTSQAQEQYQQEYSTYHTQYSQTTAMRTSCCFSAPSFPGQLPRRRPGRPRVKSFIDDDRVNKEKKVKNQHLWEFIYETLMNPMYNPQYLRWENQRDGVFRFVQSEAVAQLWGGRKNNENMTYEKLSRAMRHYYRRGILERVEGRRLVYKFSLKAMERIREKRNAV